MTETEQHRTAWLAVMEVLPDSQHLSHEDEPNEAWFISDVYLPESAIGQIQDCCKTCGEPQAVVGLTVKCRDWHEVCRDCGARYDQPKNPGCRRRKHPKEEK